MSRGRGGDALDRWLRGEAGPGSVRVEETPAAKVFIGPDRVLKIKAPVDFGFLDFTTLAKREWAIRRELAFNRQTAPDVYRAVHAIVRQPGGGFALDDGEGGGHEGELVEWVLEMRPFRAPVLSAHPETVDERLADRLGREAARLHARAPVAASRPRPADRFDYVLASNAQQLRSLGRTLDQGAVDRLIAESRAAFETLVPRLDRRGEAGCVRRCHGDLHLGNIVVEDGRPILFDCIEFNDLLSEIDIAYDIAFLVMDLDFRGRQEAANRVLNAWLDEAARRFGDEACESLALLPLCQSVRAAVRGHVSGHGGETERARAYIEAALAHLAPPPPELFAVGGLSGAGKSTLARALAPHLGTRPGAAVLRSDEIRKRLWGIGPLDRLPSEAYGPDQSEKVYRAMLQTAHQGLSAGWTVVMDAAFLTLAERAAAQALSADLGVPFQGVWLEAPAEVLRARVRDRRDDASDADERVLNGQLARDAGEIRWRRVNAETSLHDQIAAARSTR